jgi:hypothetical protein
VARISIRLPLPIPAAVILLLHGIGSGTEYPCFCNGLAIYTHYPARPFLVDPLGRRLGTDPKDGAFYNEMNALYTEGDPSNTSHPSLPQIREVHPLRYIHMRPMLGKYRIYAVGVDTGRYRMEIIAIRGDCSQRTTLRAGNTRKGKVDAYGLEYRDGSGDTVPPTTWIDYAEGRWLNRPRSAIRLQAEDACSGLAKIHVKADGGEETGPGVLEMRKEGESNLEFWSVDNAGNEEARRKMKVLCDFTPPTVAHDFTGGRIVDGPVDIRFHALDSVSGRADMKIRVRRLWNTSPVDPHSLEYMVSGDRLRLSEPGSYFLRYNAVDPAGNGSEMKTLELEIRKEPWYRRWLPVRGR